VADQTSKLPGAGECSSRSKGAKHGLINGEAQDNAHKNEIEVLSWSWGIQAGRLSARRGDRQGHDCGNCGSSRRSTRRRPR